MRPWLLRLLLSASITLSPPCQPGATMDDLESA